jgi:hypothetical protein
MPEYARSGVAGRSARAAPGARKALRAVSTARPSSTTAAAQRSGVAIGATRLATAAPPATAIVA